MNISVFKKIDISEKAGRVYLALLRLGPSSVRQLADECDLNRGTTYDALKLLQERGLVRYFKARTKQQFVAEDPAVLESLVAAQEAALARTKQAVHELIPELQALHHSGGERPIAKYYTQDELQHILLDVLETCEHAEDPMYRIYSAAGVRTCLYEAYPEFTQERIRRGIHVRALAIGDGGRLHGLDERKYLSQVSQDTPTYILIYPGKTAYISLDAKGSPIGVVIENHGISFTQQQLFDVLWNQY
jgi:sugar-specific transcriptional regulator TrmB